MPRFSRRWVFFLTTLVLGGAAILLAFSLLVNSRRNTEMATGRELQAIAVSAAVRIDAEAYQQLFFKKTDLRPDLAAAPGDPRFVRLQMVLREAVAAYSYLKLGQDNIYTFVVPDGAAALFWGVMLHQAPFTGEKYHPPDAARAAIEYKRPGYSGTYLSSASKREWISGYAPIILRGRVIGLVEVAREISEVLTAARSGVWPVLLVSIGILLLCAAAILIITHFARRLQRTNTKLTVSIDRLTQANAVSQHLRESSSDIIFALGADLQVVSINSAARRQLGIDTKSAIGQSLADVLCAPGENRNADYLFDPELLRRALANLKAPGEKMNLTATLSSRLTGEPKDYRILVERIADSAEISYIGRAVSLGDIMIASLLERTRMRFTLGNSLLLTEEMASFLAGLCRRFLDETRTTTYRIMLREMLLNAIEHGNLEIDFDTKTQSLMTDTYFDLLDERRRREPYRDRTVTIDCVIDAAKIAFRISDQGQGFDHRGMIAKLRDEHNDSPHGRGIIMTLQEFDKVRYNDKGNSVVLIKYL